MKNNNDNFDNYSYDIPVSKTKSSANVDFEPTADDQKKNQNGKKTAVSIICALTALAMIAVIIAVPVKYGGYKNLWYEINGGRINYPYVFVHGLGGWGEDGGLDTASPYWGSSAGSITDYLKNEGFDVCAPGVGPISSTWDRACELYAQLTGTTVDYGAYHSEMHKHARFGRQYTTALVPQWGERINGGQRVKINLVGHSYGGETARLLASLLEYGDENEQNASGNETSPLFTGGKGSYVFSVTTLCSPHNGTSLTCLINSVGRLIGLDSTTDLLTTVCFAAAGVTSPVSGVYDFMLDQFGVGKINGGLSEIKNAVRAVVESDNDHAGYDLSPDGAKELNSKIKTVKDVYYFSYSYCSTKDASVLNRQTADLKISLPVLIGFSDAMGMYTGVTDGGINIDSSWQANDGLVNVVSAKYPLGEEHEEYIQDSTKVKKGIWYVMPTRSGHHGTVIGMDGNTSEVRQFYSDLTSMIENLR